ncbi:hypothetical protein [Algibacter lectus]|uniref:hypothetical protein n=1 Tax=Algibacter lectus TaxID=221126 RepID=UPI0005A90F61|nr:hypothetical protein [Algibacter lectus]
MTNNIADFKDNCSTFDQDKAEFKKYKKRFEDEVNDKYATNSFEKFFSESSFIKPSNSRNPPKFSSVDKTHNLNLKNNVAHDKAILILMCLAMAYVFFVNYKDIINLTVENGVLAGFAFMLIFISVLTYRAYFMQHKIKISITKDGIEYHGNKLNWNNIVDFGILKANSTSVSEHKIIVGTITKGIIEIDLTALNISPEEFINIMRLNTKNVLQQNI